MIAALRAMPRGSARAQARARRTSVQLQIRDSGVGMDRDDLEHLRP
jgi:signal transduction histidine kinase